MSIGEVKTTCPYCGVGCGIIARSGTEGVRVAGDPDHPANFGRLCSKGAALAETLSLEGRLLHPIVNGARASWDEALDLVATRFNQTIKDHGADAVAFYVSGQLLTEDYYVANKLMKGFIGSANIDTNSRLCMASAVAGHKRAFGADVVPVSYEDLELADLVVLVGSNLAWCHPVLFQRLSEAREKRGTKIVVIDPRRTPTAEIADLFLPIAPGGDVALFNGLLHHLWTTGCADEDFFARCTSGPFEALAAASAGLNDVAEITGLDPKDLSAFYEMFARAEHVVTLFSQGVNQSSAGTDKVNAIINCHLLTGRIGRPGAGPFSITGQPNAMGGREVGGLANQLAAHMELDNPKHRAIVRRFWDAPRLAERQGLKAVDMFRAIADGRIKAIWIMGTNPAVTMPEADLVRRALRNCPFVVVSEVTAETDTAAFAHVLLPAAAWGEKSGTVTNSERRISRQRAFLPLPDEAKPDAWIIAEVANRMGFHGFDYRGPVDIFREHAVLSGEANDGTRAFDISAFANISEREYEALEPFRWPAPAGASRASAREMFAAGRFFTSDRRACLVPTPFRKPCSSASPEYPLILNTGRLRDQWHTMTRTGKVARLMDQAPEPYLAIHPEDAVRYGLNDGALGEAANKLGKAILRIRISNAEAPGTVFMPMHWSDTFASSAR
ncbi:MAG: nitrate reductase, partial [Alphaproteobacteria bacterium]